MQQGRFQKFAIFYGQGANGKTVCCVVLRALLGANNVCGVNLEAFDPRRTFNLAATVGKLANVVEELNVNSKAEEGELKKFVSGGLMTVERKHKDPFEITPTARLTFATNTLPRLADSSEGIWRRVNLYPFKTQILEPEKQNRDLVDPKYWAESGELPGILNWALKGLFRLRKNGRFTESFEMKSGLSEFKIESNPTRDFLIGFCEVKDGKVLSSKKLYQVYRSHMEANGYQPLPMNRFTSEVRITFPKAGKSDHAVMYEGYRAHVWYNLDFQIGVHA